MWFEEEVEAVDCGDEAAKWISSYVKKEDNSLRIGWYETQDNAKRRNLNAPAWNKFTKLYNRMKNEYTVSDLVSEINYVNLCQFPEQSKFLTRIMIFT